MKKLKIGISVAALVAAAGITFFFSGSNEAPPNTEDSKTLWKCAECGHTFELTAQQFIEEEKHALVIPLYCPKCSKKSAYLPLTCRKCDTLFFGPEVPGSSGNCPICHPKMTKPEPDAEQAVKENIKAL